MEAFIALRSRRSSAASRESGGPSRRRIDVDAVGKTIIGRLRDLDAVKAARTSFGRGKTEARCSFATFRRRIPILLQEQSRIATTATRLRVRLLAFNAPRVPPDRVPDGWR